jgi:hypothetical protein
MPNGKDAIRINGRIAARPMEPGDAECCISIAGIPYTVTRRGKDAFEIIEDPLASAQARNRSMANAAMAKSPRSAVPMRKSSVLTMPVLAWGSVVVLAAAMIYFAAGPSYDKLAGQRVDQILHEMMSGRGAEMQLAITLWVKNKRVLETTDMLALASDQFDRWRREKDLYNKPFSRYAIVKTELLKDEKIPTAIVTFTIEDKEYKVRVPKDLPISWEN